jgi:hypothetical protein
VISLPFMASNGVNDVCPDPVQPLP